MDIRDYEYIVQIAEQHSITKAAATLFITQSALTKFLQRTEQTLGVKLFVRNGHQFLLTENGRDYVETGRVIMKLDRDLMQKLESAATLQRKQLRFGFGMGRMSYIYENILSPFQTACPDIELKLKLDTSRHLMMALENNQLDLAILSNVEELPGYTYIPYDTMYLSALVPENSPLIKKAVREKGYPFPVISFADLRGQRFIMSNSDTRSGSQSMAILKKNLPNAFVALEVTDTRSLIYSVTEGFGIALCLASPRGSRGIEQLSIREGGDIVQNVSIVYRQDKAISQAMQILIDLLQGVTGSGISS